MWVKFKEGYTVKGGARTSFKMGGEYEMSQASADHFIRRNLADPCAEPKATPTDTTQEETEPEKAEQPSETPAALPDAPERRGRKGRQKPAPATVKTDPDPNASPKVANLKTVFGDDPGGESP